MRPIEVVLYFIIFQHKIKYTKQQFDLANSCLGNEKGEGDESLKSKVGGVCGIVELWNRGIVEL